MQDVCTDQEMVQLLERARRRDAVALDRLYLLYIDKVYRYIWYRVGDQALAEDLAMDVFVRLVENIARFRVPSEQQVAAFSAWLFRIAGNRVTDHYRRQARADRFREKRMSELASGDTEEQGQNRLERLADRDELRQAMEELNENQRQVLYYRFVADLSSAQTARAMKKSEGAVKALQHRALENLRRLLSSPSKGQGSKA
ncbi:MAG: sigma-70 family RNA polymerase sigma factor [Caldilineales bacterium]